MACRISVSLVVYSKSVQKWPSRSVGPKVRPYLWQATGWRAPPPFPGYKHPVTSERIDQISITVVLDEEDMGGPAAFADFQRLTESAPNPLLLKDGRWHWAKGEDAKRKFIDIDGTEVEANAYSPLDVLSLSTATNAKSIHFDLVYGVSAKPPQG